MTRAQRIADAIKRALEVRAGERLTPDIIEDRANNGSHYVLEALLEEEQTPAGYEVHGTIEEMEADAIRLIK